MRGTFVARACGSDDALRREVESLLAHHDADASGRPLSGATAVDDSWRAARDAAGTAFYTASSDARTTGSDSGLPPDLLNKSRRRLELVAWLVLTATLADLLVAVVTLIVSPAPWTATLAPMRVPLTSNAIHLLMGVGVIVAVRSGALPTSRLQDLSLLFEVILCLTLSVSNPLVFFRDTGVLPTLTWVTPLIILFPLIVPCPPRRTLVGAGLAASTAPFGLWLLKTFAGVGVPTNAYLAVSFGPTIAVVMAYFGSRVVYGLGREVAEAPPHGELPARAAARSWRDGRSLAGPAPPARAAGRRQARPARTAPVGRRSRATTARCSDSSAKRRPRRRCARPHTVGLYDFGVATDGAFYYVMELLDGCNADVLVRRFGPLPADRAVGLLRQVCHSLAEAHDRGVIHRDIKPANIFVCRYGRDVDFVKVLDFGLAKSVADRRRNAT